MNREILFKAKRKDNNEWVYGYLVEYADYNTIYINGSHPKTSYIFPMDERSQLKSLEKRIEVIPETVCQYISSDDKNGKKIFENDIVEYDTCSRFVVTFDEMLIMCPRDKIEMSAPVFCGYLCDDEDKILCPLGMTDVLCEVIGNKFDDGELIC